MAYVKTTWVEGAAPGISAANLNNLETQYDAAAADLATHKAAAVLDHPDGSVTTAKLANGAVTAAKVAADVATQAELDAHTSRTDNPHGVTAAQIGASAILEQLLTVDGPGSGLDADSVRGVKIAYGTYSGSSSVKTIAVGFQPRVVLIMRVGGSYGWFTLDSSGASLVESSAASFQTYPRLATTGFTVGSAATTAGLSGNNYNWVAIG